MFHRLGDWRVSWRLRGSGYKWIAVYKGKEGEGFTFVIQWRRWGR